MSMPGLPDIPPHVATFGLFGSRGGMDGPWASLVRLFSDLRLPVLTPPWVPYVSLTSAINAASEGGFVALPPVAPGEPGRVSAARSGRVTEAFTASDVELLDRLMRLAIRGLPRMYRPGEDTYAFTRHFTPVPGGFEEDLRG